MKMTSQQIDEQIKILEENSSFLKKQIRALKIYRLTTKTKGTSFFSAKVIEKITSPFVNLHKEAQARIANPEAFAVKELTKKANKLNKQLSTLKPGDKQVHKYLKKTVELVMELGDKVSIMEKKEESYDMLPTYPYVAITELEEQIERLRPPLTKEQILAREEFINTAKLIQKEM